MAQMSATIGLLVTLAQALAAPTVSVQDRPSAQLGRAPEAPKTPGPSQRTRTPLEGLFAPMTPVPAQLPLRGGAATALREQPKVVCGMMVVPVNPSPDPGMVKPIPSDLTFTMRVIVPPMCQD